MTAFKNKKSLNNQKTTYWNKYKTSIGAGNPTTLIIWHDGQDRHVMGKEIVFGDEKSVLKDWPALLVIFL